MEPRYLNSDVLFEILSRMPLKTLSRCRLLSKECNTLTYESRFMQLHSQKTNTIAGYFIQSSRNNRPHSTFCSVDNPGVDARQLSLDFLPENVKICASADQGLIFCQSHSLPKGYYICKPSTRQWETIPNPSPRYFTCMIGMLVLGSDPLRFKILRVSDPEPKDTELETEYSEPELDDYRRHPCEIFDSDNWAWKQLGDLLLPFDEYFDLAPAISKHGRLHWLASIGDKKNILTFCEDTESWDSIELPESLCQNVNLAEYEGKVAIIYQRPENHLVELWVMKDYYGEKLWSKAHTVNLAALCQDNGFGSACALYNADTIFIQGFYTSIFYNFKNGQFDRVKLPSACMFGESAFFIQTDYKPICLRHLRANSALPMTSLLKEGRKNNEESGKEAKRRRNQDRSDQTKGFLILSFLLILLYFRIPLGSVYTL